MGDNSKYPAMKDVSPRMVFSDLAPWHHHIYLWHHANTKYWYCGAIFVDFSCTRKSGQSWFLPVTNYSEYRFPAIHGVTCKKGYFIFFVDTFQITYPIH